MRQASQDFNTFGGCKKGWGRHRSRQRQFGQTAWLLCQRSVGITASNSSWLENQFFPNILKERRERWDEATVLGGHWCETDGEAAMILRGRCQDLATASQRCFRQEHTKGGGSGKELSRRRRRTCQEKSGREVTDQSRPWRQTEETLCRGTSTRLSVCQVQEPPAICACLHLI